MIFCYNIDIAKTIFMELDYSLIFSLLAMLLSTFYLFRGRANSKNKKTNIVSFVNNFSIDLTALAREGKLDPVVGRDKEIRKVIQVLFRRRKNNIIIFGKAGIGKTSIVEGLAIAIAKGLVPKNLADKIVLKIDISSILAGTKYRGAF